MAVPSNPRNSLIPTFLYSSSNGHSELHQIVSRISSNPRFAVSPTKNSSRFVIPSAKEPSSSKSEISKPEQFFFACPIIGFFSSGLTSVPIIPLDNVISNMQIDPAKYKSFSSSFGVLLKEHGHRGIFKDGLLKMLSYGIHGWHFGLYEIFKYLYFDIVETIEPEYSTKYKTLIYLAGSASAGMILKDHMMDGLLTCVWGRQVPCQSKKYFWSHQMPYITTKFAAFDIIVENIYKHAISTPKDECSKQLQLGVSFGGGYVAGVLAAIVSLPAHNLISFLDTAKDATVVDAVKKLGLWRVCTRGLPLRIGMIGTLTGAQWGLYDAFKIFIGLPTTCGPIVHPEPAKENEG